jgi:hypothetical protein
MQDCSSRRCGWSPSISVFQLDENLLKPRRGNESCDNLKIESSWEEYFWLRDQIRYVFWWYPKLVRGWDYSFHYKIELHGSYVRRKSNPHCTK